jgi:glycosyltransferase involved in cell wall biosynthesis
LEWVVDTYTEFRLQCKRASPDAIFIFHILHQFPAEVRRHLLELGLDVPIVGYSHGSHWDPTDSFRHRHYRGLEHADLANLLTLDAILCVSDSFRHTLVDEISSFSRAAADIIHNRSVTVGLPIDTDAIDRHPNRDGHTNGNRIVFNHSLVPEKGASTFVKAAHILLHRHPDLSVTFTRRPDETHHEIRDNVYELHDMWPDRVALGHDLQLDDYYAELAAASHQVSTAIHDSFGIATVEAMYARCCSILPPLPAYREIFRGDPDAAVFHDGSVRGIVAAYSDTLESSKHLSLAARHRNAVLRFRPENVTSRILNHMTGLLPGRRPRD